MSDPIPPFLEPAPGPATRLEAPVEFPTAFMAATPKNTSSIGLGAFILGFGFCTIWAGDFIADQFSRNAILGYATLGIGITGATMITIGIAREILSLSALHRIETLRADFSSPNADHRARAVKAWLAKLPKAESEGLRDTMRGINDPDAMIAILRAGPQADRLSRGDAAARAAALQLAAGLAAMPSPVFAALFTFWRGLRLIRGKCGRNRNGHQRCGTCDTFKPGATTSGR